MMPQVNLDNLHEVHSVIYGYVEEIILRLNRLAKGYYHTDFGDAIFIYQKATDLAQFMEVLMHYEDQMEAKQPANAEEGSAK